ncbi:DsbA family protein [Polymorphobacter multimanifer]|uniref:Protein-disulfide isomerase n=1 Tax=Polymorphobacter multimanifer TaxID=1070431 RepID=A0A841L729_9SPHN|nr:DsbA family protein [Polymorphobacter multimanifer]MBB6227381.1 protein-disulfide isomerase [Polymorphobacter multimanifer]
MAQAVSRRQLLQLGAVVVVGWGAAKVFQRAAPIGRDVGTNLTAQRLLQDRLSPRTEVRGADLTMVVFTDYQCAACKVAAPAMAAAVADDGRVRLIYREWPIFGPRSERAARVALASAAQGVYPQVHRRLMAERRQLDDAVLQAVVEASGGDWARLLADLDRLAQPIDQLIARTSQDAFALSLPGTPAFVIGTILVVGGMDEDGFARAFAEARARPR